MPPLTLMVAWGHSAKDALKHVIGSPHSLTNSTERTADHDLLQITAR
jgi:hypothetical protein